MKFLRFISDMAGVRLRVLPPDLKQSNRVRWELEMKAVSLVEPSQLVRNLTGAILGCGGWVLSRGSSDCGLVNLLFEFERHACVDIYTTLISSGVELSHNGHIRLTELCQCTRNHFRDCGAEIASVDLEIQTFPPEIIYSAIASECA